MCAFSGFEVLGEQTSFGFFGDCARFVPNSLAQLNLWTSIDSETIATEGSLNGERDAAHS